MDYIQLGYNFRISNILAALGISQLAKIKKVIKMRRENADYLTKKLLLIKEITVPACPDNCLHLYQMYTIKVGEGRSELMKYLNSRGIMAKVYFHPIHLSAFYKKSFGYKKGDLPKTEKISDSVLTLPMYPDLKKAEMDFMAKEIKKFFR